METILIDNVEYNIPTSWEDVTLGQYVELMTMPTGLTKGNITARTFYICGKIPIAVTRKLENLGYELAQINNLLSFITEEKLPEDSINHFEFEGHTYYVEPLVDSDFGAYWDYDEFLEKEGPIKGLPYFLAIIARRASEKYADIDTYERAEIFKRLPMTTANRVAAFFLLNSKNSETLMRLVLSQINQATVLRQYTLSYLKSLAGSGSFLERLRTTILLKLMAFFDKKLYSSLKHFTTSPLSREQTKEHTN